MKKTIAILALAIVLLSAVAAIATTGPASANIEGYVHPDGTYRGGYINPVQTEVQFKLKDGLFTEIRYRALGYRGVDYLKSEDAAVLGITQQYQDLADYLIGKDVSALMELYHPANITKDTDTFTAATLRSSKLVSSINDGLNRGLYALPTE
mgnify:FL=1